MHHKRVFPFLFLSFSIACAPGEPSPDVDIEEEALLDPGAQSFLLDAEDAEFEKTYWEGSATALCMLELANSEDESFLVEQALLHPQVADAIVRYRTERASFAQLNDLDDVPYFGHASAASLAALAEEGRCTDDVEDPRPAQQTALRGLIDELNAQMGNAPLLDVDIEALKEKSDRIIVRGAGTQHAYLHAMREIMLALPNGHAGAYDISNDSSSGVPAFGRVSTWGVCALPHDEGYVITFADDANPLGLAVGDVVKEVDSRSDAELDLWLLTQPMSEATSASPSSIRHLAASGLFSTLRAGSTLLIQTPDGSERSTFVDVPQSNPTRTDCFNPFGKPRFDDAYLERRPDGISVIRLPDFAVNGNFGNDSQAITQALVDGIKPIFDAAVLDAEGIIWDVRGNGGGNSLVGFLIVQGFPSARAHDLSRCLARDPGSENYFPAGGNFSIEPGSVVSADGFVFDSQGAFLTDLPVAVVTDGGAVSAADYFALAVKRASDAILVGAPTAGGYGSSTLNIPTGEFAAISDALLCEDSAGIPLEGMGVEPDVVVGYDAAALAQGRDNVLDVAANLLLN